MFRSLVVCCWLLAWGSPLWAQPDFNRDIAPILSDNCYVCHGPDARAREADLRLDRQESLRDVAGSGVDDSELLRRISTDDVDELMPPPSSKLRLSDQQRKLLHDWIQAGAPWEGHWSFRKPERPTPPRLQRRSWPRNPIDLFVLNQSERRQLNHAAEASRERILRRVTLDLTGLPPTLEEMDDFLGDDGPLAYERVVDRLLASPRFGERMAMTWLDAARYADTNGYQGDRERTMWPWRDWVVEALNKGLRHDQFTEWQLAGDLLPNHTEEQKLATGFCRNHMINGEGGRIAEENRVEYIFDQIETVGTVWLGLTVQCCRCHDHKFDALSQREYFQLFAFFNQTPVDGGGGDPRMAPVMDVPTKRQKRRLQLLNDQLADTARQLLSREAPLKRDASKELLGTLETAPLARQPDQWKAYVAQFEKVAPNVASVAQTLRDTQSKRDAVRRSVAKVMVMEDRPQDQRRETYVLEKGLYNQRGETVSAGVPAAILPLRSQGDVNRLTLARWLTSADHPLTARVTVNQFWQGFFGTGLVKTTEDFGIQGEKPTHPDLLDWLAVEFIESGWNVKHLVRLIVTSSTYRQSARVEPGSVEADPTNRWLTRGPRRRMPSWMIRDHALAASSLLTGTIGGPPVFPYQPAGVWEEASFGKKKYQQDHGKALYRRSLYVFWRRIVGPTMFFDAPKRQTCSVRANQTNTPLHALVTLNDTTYVEAARGLAHRVVEADSDDRLRLQRAYRIVTSRVPTEQTMLILLDRLTQLRRYYQDHPKEASRLLAVGDWTPRVVTDSRELASYTAACLMLLNLDEALTK